MGNSIGNMIVNQCALLCYRSYIFQKITDLEVYKN